MRSVKWESRTSMGFMLVFGLAIVVMTVLGFLYKKNEEEVWKKEAVSELRKVTDFKMDQVNAWRTAVYNDAKEVARSQLLQGTICKWIIHRDSETFNEINRHFQTLLKENKNNLANIFLVDKTGKVFMNGGGHTRFIPEESTVVERVIQSQNDFFGDFYKAGPEDPILLDIAFPVIDEYRQIQAILIFQIDPAVNLFPMVNNWPYDTKNEEFFLFEQAGDSILFINKLKDTSHPAVSFSYPLSRTDNPAVAAVLHGPGTYKGIGDHGQQIIEVTEKVDDTPWYLAAKTDMAELYAPVYARLKVFTGTIIGLSLLFFFGLFIIILYRRRRFYRELLDEERKKNALKSHYEYVVEYANDIILLLDEQLNIIDANQRAIQVYQYSMDELKKLKKTDLTPPGERKTEQDRLNDVEDDKGYVLESVQQRKDGTFFDVEISERIIRVDGKKYVHQLIRDITERKRYEKALKESEERFRTTLYSTGDAIITTDLEGNIQYLNKMAGLLTGWTEAGALGKPVQDIFKVISKATGQELENPIERVLQEKMVVVLSDFAFLTNRNGQQIPIGYSGAPIRDTSGKITGVVIVFHDLTEDLKVRKALEESELHYRSLTDNAPVGIFRTQPDGFTTYVNPTWCKLSGLKKEQAMGDGWLVAVHPEDREVIASTWQEATKNQELSVKEYRFVRPDGKTVYVIGYAVPEIDPHGNITGYVGTITDITLRKEAEKKLLLFRTLIDSSNDSFEIADPETGTFLDINRKGCEDLGYSREEMLALTIFNIDPMVTKPIFREEMKKLQHAGNTILEGIHRRKDGSSYPVEVNTQLVSLDRDYVVSVARDITARKQAEKVLQESEEKFRNIFTFAPVGIYQSWPDGSFITVNDQLVRILGYASIDELMAVNLSEIYFNKNERERLIKKYEPMGSVQRVEIRWKKKDGTPLWIWLSSHSFKDPDGHILFYEGFVQDITLQKASEEKLQLLSKSVENNPVSIVITDKSGRIEYVNPRFTDISGYAIEEVLGKNPRILKSNEHPKAFYETLWKTILGGNVWRGEFHNKKKTGELYWESATIAPVKDEFEKIAHFVGVKEDITERKKILQDLQEALDKARESDRLKSAFLTNMSHEIRTPMNGILGVISLLEQPGISDEEKKEYINLINKSGERLLNTINDIMEISKIEVGDISLNYEIVDITELMQFYYNFFSMQAKEKGLSLNITRQIDGDAAIIKTDKYKLDSILMNLIKNAIKFTERGNIEIGNYLEKGKLYFYVTDTGSGIPEEKLTVIFDRFVQADHKLNRGYEGSGIGLSIVKAYTEALNGHVEVKSEVGSGSTFLFSIVYHPEDQHTESPLSESKHPVQTPDHGITVLVAEDDEVNYFLLEKILSKEFRILHAVNSAESVRLFRDHPEISMVLMDIKMSGKYDGLEAIRKIRQLDQEVPIVAQTAYATEFDRMKAFDAGCNDYITKPFTDTHLLSIMRKYCTQN